MHALGVALDALAADADESPAVWHDRGHAGYSPRLTAGVGLAQVVDGRPGSVERLRWLLDTGAPLWAWPEFVHPRTGGGSGGQGHDGSATVAFLDLVRAMAVIETPTGLDLLPAVPAEWYGQPVEVHGVPTAHGTLSFAVRWHGERPALLWELEPHRWPGTRSDRRRGHAARTRPRSRLAHDAGQGRGAAGRSAPRTDGDPHRCDGSGTAPGRRCRLAARRARDPGPELTTARRGGLVLVTTDGTDDPDEHPPLDAIGLDALERYADLGRPEFDLADVARTSGLDLEALETFWRALGFPEAREHEKQLSGADVEMLSAVVARIADGSLDADAALQMARVIGSALDRVAAAQVDALVSRLNRSTVGTEREELRRTLDLAGLMPPVLEFVWRRQLAAAARRRLLRTAVPGEAPPVCVGFADLVGFTAQTQQLDQAELALVVGRFESIAYDVVAAPPRAGGEDHR